MRKFELCLVMVILLVLSLLAVGCGEEKQKWGQGDPPIDYRVTFGNGNLARLVFLQTERINQQNEVLLKLAEKIVELERCHSSRAAHKKRVNN